MLTSPHYKALAEARNLTAIRSPQSVSSFSFSGANHLPALMEYCVLIPKELSLAAQRKSDFLCSQQAPLTVVSNTFIAKGRRFRALEGTIRYGKVSTATSVPSELLHG